MPKLNQIVAVVATKKKDAEAAITTIYQQCQKETLFQGITRTYHAVAVDADEQPAEKKLLQLTAGQAISAFRDAMLPVFDVVLTQDTGNTYAKADVEVDGQVLVKDAAPTYLLFLEKKLTDLQTFISKLPTLDPAQTWHYDENANSYASEKTWKHHTRKEAKVITKAPATDKHPAQVEVVHEDKNVGRWETINFSGAIPAKQKHDMVVRVKTLLEAVKKAREVANLTEVTPQKCGASFFDYVFGATK